jgi:hypothetical protein
MDVFSQFTLPAVAFLLTLVFGFWLSHSGKPYNGILFNVHKLIALGAVVATVIQLSSLLQSANALALIIVVLVVAVTSVVALFASGALMSMDKLDYALVLTVHRVAPVLLVIAMALVIYLLGRTP